MPIVSKQTILNRVLVRFGFEEPNGYYQRFINNMNLGFLASAIRDRRPDEVDRLLATGLDLNPTGEGDIDVLWVAMDVAKFAQSYGYAPDLSIVIKLLAAGADPNRKGRNPLQVAAEGYFTYEGMREWPEAVDLFLGQRAIQVDKIDESGETALMKAVRLGHVNTVRRLLEAGANPLLKDNYNQTAREVMVFLQQAMGQNLSPSALQALLTAKGFRSVQMVQFPQVSPERWSMLGRLLREAEQASVR